MIARYNSKSFVYAIPGILLQIGGNFMGNIWQAPNSALLGGLLSLVGTVLLFIGLAYYAMAKGRSPAWCLLGILSCLGLLILALLKDKAPNG